jgi:hypothetical protein
MLIASKSLPASQERTYVKFDGNPATNHAEKKKNLDQEKKETNRLGRKKKGVGVVCLI